MRRKNSDRSPVRKSQTGKSHGFYTGTYKKNGPALVRDGDGLILKIAQRPPHFQTRYKSPTFLVDHTTVVGGKYVSSIWDGEFEHLGLRYVMTPLDDGFTIEPKYAGEGSGGS
jgi:hypothetical protein